MYWHTWTFHVQLEFAADNFINSKIGIISTLELAKQFGLIGRFKLPGLKKSGFFSYSWADQGYVPCLLRPYFSLADGFYFRFYSGNETIWTILSSKTSSKNMCLPNGVAKMTARSLYTWGVWCFFQCWLRHEGCRSWSKR